MRDPFEAQCGVLLHAAFVHWEAGRITEGTVNIVEFCQVLVMLEPAARPIMLNGLYEMAERSSAGAGSDLMQWLMRRIVESNLSTGSVQHAIAQPKDHECIPPRNWEYLLYLLLPRAQRESVLGDLEEDFGNVVSKFGRWPASIWYAKQVTVSVAPFVVRWVKWISARMGITGGVYELWQIIHRFI